jgi:hypothetical protein
MITVKVIPHRIGWAPIFPSRELPWAPSQIAGHLTANVQFYGLKELRYKGQGNQLRRPGVREAVAAVRGLHFGAAMDLAERPAVVYSPTPLDYSRRGGPPRVVWLYRTDLRPLAWRLREVHGQAQ